MPAFGCPAEQEKHTGRRAVEGAREDAGSLPSASSVPKEKYTWAQGRRVPLAGAGKGGSGPPRLRLLILLLLTPQPLPTTEGAAPLKRAECPSESLFLAKVFL